MGQSGIRFIRAVCVFSAVIGAASAKIGDNVVHPAWEMTTIPMPAQYKGMGIAFLPDGRMVFATGYVEDGRTTVGEESRVFVAGGVSGSSPTVNLLASHFINPSGIVTVGDKVYLADRDGFYEITSTTDFANVRANRKKILAWPFAPLWHQWVFTPMYRGDGWFYAPYSGSIKGGGPSDVPSTGPYSGAFLRWNLTGTVEKWAGGLRSPNGANIDKNGNMFVADNQGSWLPTSTLAHMKQGRFYGHRQSPPHAPNWAESLPYQPPVAWYPHGTVRSSPGQPISIEKGIYAGQWLQGDCNGTGLLRISLDSVGGDYQGAVFWFSNGTTNAAINRLAWGPDGALYIQSVEKMGNWPGNGTMPMYRLAPKAGVTAFEMLAIRSIRDGFLVEFTKPVDKATVNAAVFSLKQWGYVREAGYGAGKTAEVTRTVTSAVVSADGRVVELKVSGLQADRVTYFKLGALKSSTGESLFDTEAWYTLNKINQSTSTWKERLAGLPGWSRQVGFAAETGARLRVDLALEGPVTVELRALDGALAARAAGERTLILSASRSGVYVAQVRHARGSFSRKIAL